MKATFGGPGFQQRQTHHEEEIGTLWTSCGVQDEVSPLKRVLMTRPPKALGRPMDLEANLMVSQPDLPEIEAASLRLEGALIARGVDVCWIDERYGPPNLLYARDLYAMTQEGAIVARMAGQARAGEERLAAAALARIGVPILSTLVEGSFEGADLLWLGATLALVGVGLRTDPVAIERLAEVLDSQGTALVSVPMPKDGAQHLLGVMMMLDHDLAAVRKDKADPTLVQLLRSFEIEVIELPDDDEMVAGRGLNGLVLAPREFLMPSGAPGIRARLEAHGVTCHEVDVTAYLAAGGAIGCAVGVLERA